MSHKRRSSDAAAVEMPHKRRGHDDDPNQQRAGGGGKRQSRRRKHYLYLVLDDWEKGFSIHKIDADTFDSNNSDDSDDEEELGEMIHHLPEHPALRLEQPVYMYPQTNDTTDDMSSARRRMLPRLQTDMAFAAMGTKIFALMNQRCGLVYDAETAVMSIGAHAPARMACGSGIFLAAGDVLYALMYSRKLDKQHPHSFQAMSLAPTQDDDDARGQHHPTQAWTWNTLPPPPFASYVHSYALHPDGHTIFMTSANDKGRMGTYSFDTNVDDPAAAAWRYHGNWVLPFQGKGHYDGDLDAWVGLHRDAGGYVCCCRPVSPSFQSTAPCFYVDCKMAKEKMFSKRHIRVSLTYMGASKFCLVECVAAKKMGRGQTIYGPHDGCIIHLTIFGLKYNHTGELQITEDRSARSFLVSRHRDHFAPAAFWM